MSQMTDSAKQTLNTADIIMAALKNTKSKIPPKLAYPAIMAEMSQPNTDVKQLGNTIFVLHRVDEDRAFLKL